MRAFFTAGVILVGLAQSAAAQELYRPYDGIQAGIDAYRLAEERRQAAVAGQLATNDLLRASAGLPPNRGHAMYYGYPGVYFPAPSREYAYAYGRPWFGPRTVFEPWPVVGGDIYGFTYAPPVRQPIGRWEGQTGPSRWESHPLYDPPLDNPPLVAPPLYDRRPIVTPKIVGPPEDEKSRPAELLDEVPPEPPAPPDPPAPLGREL